MLRPSAYEIMAIHHTNRKRGIKHDIATTLCNGSSTVEEI